MELMIEKITKEQALEVFPQCDELGDIKQSYRASAPDGYFEDMVFFETQDGTFHSAFLKELIETKSFSELMDFLALNWKD